MADAVTDAWRRLDGKISVPSEMRTAQWSRVPQWIRERSFYMAGVMRAVILDAFRREVADIASGKTGEEAALKRLQQFLEQLGYEPEPGQEGTIKDLRTARRILTTLRTNVSLLQAWGQKERGLQPGALRATPGWELVRVIPKKVPRNWLRRWQQVGGRLVDGRMIAVKTDAIWQRLGSRENFPDALGVDYPPFAFGSGMMWRGVGFREMDGLGFGDAIRAQTAALAARPRPVGSPNETLETRPDIDDAQLRKQLAEHLGGLAEWQGEVLVFTDPNGTRPYPAHRLANVVTAKLPESLPNLQADAAKAWGLDALGNVKLRAGTDRTDDFVRFVRRTESLAGDVPVWRGEYFARRQDLEERLARLAEGDTVKMTADSWTLLETVARFFAAAKGMPYELILLSRSHGSLKPIYPAIAKVVPRYGKQAEVIALEGTRFRIVGEPVFSRSGGVTRVQIEVEEVPQ